MIIVTLVRQFCPKLFYAKILQGISALIWNILDREFWRFEENICLVCVTVKDFLYGCCMLEDNRSVRYEVACWLQHHWLEELTTLLTMIPISHTTWSRSLHALQEREPGESRERWFPGLVTIWSHKSPMLSGRVQCLTYLPLPRPPINSTSH